jgi:hypothetical protein
MTGASYAIHASRPQSGVADGEPPSTRRDENRRAADPRARGDDESRPAPAGSEEPENGAFRRWASTPIPCARRPWSSSFPD